MGPPLRDGAPVEGYFGDRYVRANWSPAFVDHLVEGLLRTVRYYEEVGLLPGVCRVRLLKTGAVLSLLIILKV